MNNIISYENFSCIVLNGYEILIDTEDIPRINCFKWYLTYDAKKQPKYVKALLGDASNKGKRWDIYLHRYVMSFPNNLVDHSNRNTLDNRKCNLREATPQQNVANSKRKLNRYGFIGVAKSNSKYTAAISYKGKYIRSKVVNTPEEAAKMYDSMAKKFYGEFAITNF